MGSERVVKMGTEKVYWGGMLLLLLLAIRWVGNGDGVGEGG